MPRQQTTPKSLASPNTTGLKLLPTSGHITSPILLTEQVTQLCIASEGQGKGTPVVWPERGQWEIFGRKHNMATIAPHSTQRIPCPYHAFQRD